jgi:hypothetical protein
MVLIGLATLALGGLVFFLSGRASRRARRTGYADSV